MANRERPKDRGVRRADEALKALGRQAREARIAAGLSQADVADAARISRPWLSRFERGEASGMTFDTVFVNLAVLGLDVFVRAYPAGDPIRDAAQARLLARFHAELHASVRWGIEVPLPQSGDLRAWDGLLMIGTARWGVEAETRIHDLQARARSLQLKRRDGGVDGVILLLADTRHHRALLRQHEVLIQGLCPVPGSDALTALRAGRVPPGDAVILL